MIGIAFFMLVSAAPASSLEIQGKPGVKVFGLCFSEDGKTVKVSETTPSEVNFDIKVQKCELKTDKSQTPLKIRLFHDRQVALERDFTGPDAGIEFVIPLTPKNKK